MLTRQTLFPEPELPDSQSLLAEGTAAARDWSVGPSAFLREHRVNDEAEFKTRCMESGRMMQHAQIGFRDLDKSCRGYAQVWEDCAAKGVDVHRYGLCLDWSMGVPAERRGSAQRGTGMILRGAEDFARLANAAPVAAHFGDFVLGFPAAFENTKYALAAGSTAIGNLGQYFSFRLPGEADDLDATAQTVRALALIGAQPVRVLVHSNLDDGYAAVMGDLTSVLGFAILEHHICDLLGVSLSHCYGHHFTDPVTRMAFQFALRRLSDVPGTQIYGATVLYQGDAAQNYASLASYLQIDIAAQILNPSGHGINPVPVTENTRIPEIDEIVDAQLFLGRAIELGQDHASMLDIGKINLVADHLVEGGSIFAKNALEGLKGIGVNTEDAFEMLLALRRIGGKKLERLFGGGVANTQGINGRMPLIEAPSFREIAEKSAEKFNALNPDVVERIKAAGLTAVTATTDVHEHGKILLDQLFDALGIEVVDGGVSVDVDELVGIIKVSGAQFLAVSTYNGIALDYAEKLKAALAEEKLEIPVLIGGRLNQIPETSNTSLPVEVNAELNALGFHCCTDVSDAVAVLIRDVC